ncbi:hypothetical protein [Streptomyces sp. PT12]|uniref:hypothetical protein n=1 Tax=Streptomyces sp. PT12 TaxID=1510197 RepID=UPI000DE1BC1F|nr:hypothetical protein [Streptomyces sp. PT12]RBM19757.1 hypothetical protein DEH69_09680 [Streptomyces sp. PT12]
MGISAPGMRVARAAVFAALCVTLSAGAHVLLSGEPLPLPTVAVVSLAVFGLALALVGRREHGFGTIAALLVPAHLAADTVFTTGQATCYGPGGGPVTGPLRLLGVDLLCAGGDVGPPLAGLAGGDPVPFAAAPAGPWLLLAAHVAVGLAAAAWLRCGERALARTLRSAAAATFRPLFVPLTRAAVPAPVDPGPRRPRRVLAAPALPALAHSVLRRGPPVAAPAH